MKREQITIRNFFQKVCPSLRREEVHFPLWNDIHGLQILRRQEMFVPIWREADRLKDDEGDLHD